jgi:ribosomal protein S18 acetylase RimI-like enzyme
MNVRRLGPGDEHVVEALATREPPARAAELLGDDNTIFVVAFEGDEPIGLVLADDLVRRHGEPSKLFVYEVDVLPAHHRRGVGTAMLGELARIARERGVARGWVLTDRDNVAAMELYRSVGGFDPQENVLWNFEYADG